MGSILSASSLEASLSNHIHSAYLISGDDNFLVEEAVSKIISAALTNNFILGNTFYLDNSFNLQEFTLAMYAGSLFAEKNIIKLIVPSEKPGNSLKPIQEYLTQQNDQIQLIILFPKISASTKKTKWFKAFIDELAWITIWPPQSKDFLAWVKNRAQVCKLKIEENALQLLAEYTQGNLSLTMQTLNNLSHIYHNNTVNREAVNLSINDNSQYAVYELIEVVLLGNTNTALKMLARLKDIKQDTAHIVNSLLLEVNKLSQIRLHLATNNFSQLCKQYGIYKMKQAAFKDAAIRHSIKSVNNILQLLDIADEVIKGWLNLDIWIVLHEVILSFAGTSYNSHILRERDKFLYER